MKVIDFPEVRTKQGMFNFQKNSVQNKPAWENLMLVSMDDESNMIAEMLRQLEESKKSDNPYH